MAELRYPSSGIARFMPHGAGIICTRDGAAALISLQNQFDRILS
jgi:hypothetical protein